MNLHGSGNSITKMVTSVKKIIFSLSAAVCTLVQAADDWRIINTDSADLAFRQILIEKSMSEKDFSCTVTGSPFETALASLQKKETDIVLAKNDGSNLKNLPQELCFIEFAKTNFIVFVGKRNPLKKLKVSDFTKIWNGEINTWKPFDPSNIFTIHRFGMKTDDNAFEFLSKILNLRSDSQHFPLDSASQIITMVKNNPNAIGIAVSDSTLDLQGINLVQMTDDNGKNISLEMPHAVIFRKEDKERIKKFLNLKKD